MAGRFRRVRITRYALSWTHAPTTSNAVHIGGSVRRSHYRVTTLCAFSNVQPRREPSYQFRQP
jgi:hypothetical protein